MALPTAADIQGRVDFDLAQTETGDDITTIVTNAIQDLFVEAKHYGSSYWTEDTLPDIVKTQIMRATVRYAKNLDGFNVSRAGDEQVGWADDRSGMAGSAHFSDVEIDIIKESELDGAQSLMSAGSFAWNPGYSNSTGAVYVPVDTGGYFPLFGGRLDG